MKNERNAGLKTNNKETKKIYLKLSIYETSLKILKTSKTMYFLINGYKKLNVEFRQTETNQWKIPKKMKKYFNKW